MNLKTPPINLNRYYRKVKQKETKKKWEEKKLYSHIQNIYQEMDDEEKEEFLKITEGICF